MNILLRLAQLVTFYLLLIQYGATPARLGPVVSGPVAIRMTPQRVAPPFIDARRLSLRRAWTLAAADGSVGGVSALAVRDGQVLAVADTGSVYRFPIVASGVAAGGSQSSLPPACGVRSRKRDQDLEAITTDPDSGARWVTMEWSNSICRIGGSDGTRDALARPAALRPLPDTGGAEGMARLADGRFAVFAERAVDGQGPYPPVFLYAQDPVARPDVKPATLHYRTPEDYDVSDAALLPDGRLLVMLRRFSLLTGFDSQLQLATPRWQAGETISGRTILTLDGDQLGDNFEGIAVEPRADGRTVIWLVSDDNFLSFQKTWLLELDWKG